MKRWWVNSMLFKKEFEHRCRLSKSTSSRGPIENASESKDPNINDTNKNIQDWDGHDNYSNVDPFFGVKDIRNFISDKTLLVKDSNGDSYSIYFDSENQIFEIDNGHPFCSELESSFSSYLNNGSKSKNPHHDGYTDDTQYSWNNHINSCIKSYLQSQICIDGSILSGSDNYSNNYIYSSICGESGNSSKSEGATRTNGKTIEESSTDLDETDPYETYLDETDLDETDPDENDLDENDPYVTDPDETNPDVTDPDVTDPDETDPDGTDPHGTQKYRHLWVQCENCYGLNYKKFFKSKMNLCEQCGFHLKMSSSDRIELSIDPGTWEPMDEDMVSLDPIEFDSEEEPYTNRIDSYQRKTGLTEAVQTGIGQLNGINVAIGVMDFQFMGGSMGSVVGEKITRLIEYATKEFLPLIIVCASGGARMQEGSLSLMQMAKISSALYDYQSNKKLFYVPILTSPTTGGVTASFGMLGDIIIAEPNAYIAFAGKRVIEQTLNKTVPEGSQEAEYLFEKGLFDLIVPRNLLKSVLSELFQLHNFFPLNQN
uniref:Acetyl-coenzyme A carboxylase carboxyl transferase subunit beta n=1 Tax=Chuquiraga oppositifolia TaxID=171763 RepID=A0A7D5JAE0_9ASTR|nr:AccD [Chuquiraga oppositifolia]QLF67622.1 AccD [Chuquiraga oppositifolia]